VTARDITVTITGPTPVERILADVARELDRARRAHGPMHSPHEGIATIHEEFLELRDHVYHDTGRAPEARGEALQLAAMAVRYILDLVDLV
jgi:hypothetical protein